MQSSAWRWLVDLVFSEWAWQEGYKKAKSSQSQSFETFSEGEEFFNTQRSSWENLGFLLLKIWRLLNSTGESLFNVFRKLRSCPLNCPVAKNPLGLFLRVGLPLPSRKDAGINSHKNPVATRQLGRKFLWDGSSLCAWCWAAEHGKHLLHEWHIALCDIYNPSSQVYAGSGGLPELFSTQNLYDVYFASSHDEGSPSL